MASARGETYPKVEFGATERRGVPFQSAVFWKTMLPHHVWMVFAPIVPALGNCRQKKMITAETATPESSAADKT